MEHGALGRNVIMDVIIHFKASNKRTERVAIDNTVYAAYNP